MEFPENIEQWRLVSGYTIYEVSSHGRIRNNKTLNVMKPYLNREGGYLILKLYKNKKLTTHTIHSLVANAFCENPNNYDQIDHIDRVRTNNNSNNLRFCTRSQNQRNTKMHITNTSGIKGVSFDTTSNAWQVQWNDNQGKHKTKKFSVKIYGEESKQMAIDYRKQKEQECGYL